MKEIDNQIKGGNDMSNKLYYAEQIYWGINAGLLLLFGWISIVTKDIQYVFACLCGLMAVGFIGVAVFQILDYLEFKKEEELEEFEEEEL